MSELTWCLIVNADLWEELLAVLVGGRLYALAHGVRQKVAHLGVAAGAAVWGVDVVEGT